MSNLQKIIVLDFGGRHNQLIARRVREMGVYCEIIPGTKPTSEWLNDDLMGLILTGGTGSVNDPGALKPNFDLRTLPVPVLGIGYGMQLIAACAGPVSTLTLDDSSVVPVANLCGKLFDGLSATDAFLSAGSILQCAPDAFSVDASAPNCPVAALSCPGNTAFGVQFHPEVSKSKDGRAILKNFVFGICRCQPAYKLADQIDKMIADVRAQVGDQRIVAAMSGGVDSSVACVIANKAVGADHLTCVFVDTGLMRYKEGDQVIETYREKLGLNVIRIDAEDRFLSALSGVTDPEQKRKIIGETFVRVFEEEAAKTGAQFLLQGTIYPDIIESGIDGKGAVKSHHNVGGMPKESLFQKEQLVEPLKYLFKDEVRYVGESMGIPHEMLWRQPFPGPGLGVRCIGELRKDRLDILRLCDHIYREEIANAGLNEQIWQYFAILTGVQTVGVTGGERTYAECLALRAVHTEDAMTADVAELPYPLLRQITHRIIAECPGVNRVVYDITMKPPGTIEWE